MRFRRYRVFLIFAALITILLVRLSHRKDWPQYPQSQSVGGSSDTAPARPDSFPKWTPPVEEERLIGLEKSKPEAEEKPQRKPEVVLLETTPKMTPTSIPNVKTTTKSSAAAQETVPKFTLPNRQRPPPGADVYNTDVDDVHPVAPPGRQELLELPAATSAIHWSKQPEHFPVPTESIIKLPTGTPVSIPKIQYAFHEETSDMKRDREQRQTIVKQEFKKAWGGYKKHAWLHDELSPVSGKFRDPFCGWAATLVDTLDTLWIMGLEEEFEEAAKAVDLIDFTTSPRSDIPMFETTIRYLGGLLAAYDVSSGRYKNLLDKAVELADILIGAFDTPNRMPILYYRWRPAFASQPHRASQRSNLAELGSLSMEFTRLAQLTQDQRYYDAVARVTNALSEWQDRGTALGSVFPGAVDASGCNRTVELTSQQPIASFVPAMSKDDEKALGYQPDSPGTVAEPRKKGIKDSPSGPGSLQVQILPGELSKAYISDWEDPKDKVETKKTTKRDVGSEPDAASANAEEPHTPPTQVNPISDLPSRPNNGEVMQNMEIQAETASASWDCKPQGLEPSENNVNQALKFGMGGGQDSTYEYYPKQFLLLGGLETQYRKLYLKTVEDIKKWMLFRPMVPGNRDILFAGTVTTRGDPENDLQLEPEVAHLTCFIGGMIGMSAKIFGLESDLELAKKLTDACVWAYESTPTGIMPETAIAFPCASSEDCKWNETLYHQELDPIWNERDGNVESYKKAKLESDEQLAANAKALASKKEAQRLNAQKQDEEEEYDVDTHNGTAALEKDGTVSLQKRQSESSPKLEVPQPISHNFKDSSIRKIPAQDSKTPKSKPKVALSPEAEEFYHQKAASTADDLLTVATGGHMDELPSVEPVEPPMRDPSMPFTHKEFVDNRIAQEGLPPGYTYIRSNKYILRPEAIESVWYMYRITGETTWQDKGWNMFESIINSTSTKYGHSAILDVTSPRNETYQLDEMESFWTAETLKYFYLLYSTPDVISLDEWVLNTEAHPFKRP
ncbi:Endoplasmic reticulum mannosyl-oligosaccharide 1,2-alpha-mannosidase [Lachnellula hyalina]|uniref:alpha-1,2-Mannosidase n=1 Tax=Lachnellula hyalina TaxID=1316788 RepID=A0A8H8QYT0_9HELO|nr:Endoplasmic reticulum mannosyl-oligosaccharide 1,2-alpha-mannosidase [Lachnellula hyalina]TVY24531.1 Endoplasmic reticulum mannosyl-oligosaccharide 1,2-alpha-mannosidase [Lachnellula hyalina]